LVTAMILVMQPRFDSVSKIQLSRITA